MSRETVIGIGSTVVAISIALVANMAGEGSSLGEVLILVGVVVLVAATVFGLVVPWAKQAVVNQTGNRPANAGIAMSVLGFLSIVAFWSGLPVILGAGGAALGYAGRERAANIGRGGLSLAALIIGIIAVIGGAGTLLLEQLGI